MRRSSPWYLRPNDPSVVAALDHLRALHRYERRAAVVARVLRRRGEPAWASLLDALETNAILHAHQLARRIAELEAAAERPGSVPPVNEATVGEELEQEATAEVLVREIHEGLTLYDRVVKRLVAPSATRGMVIAHRQDHRGFEKELRSRMEALTVAPLPAGDAAE